jgi:hypothetical protein
VLIFRGGFDALFIFESAVLDGFTKGIVINTQFFGCLPSRQPFVKKALGLIKNLWCQYRCAFTAPTINKECFRSTVSQLVLSPNDTSLGYSKRLDHFFLPASPRFYQLRNGQPKHPLIIAPM